MSILQIMILALVQGLAELLPVSSSAHVIFAQKLMGLDPSAPAMTFLLVMLHTGTMFAVLLYFWKRWRDLLFKSSSAKRFLRSLVIATIVTGVLGFGLKLLIEKLILEHIMGYPKGEVEQLFSFLPLIAGSLFLVGLFILYAGLRAPKQGRSEINDKQSAIVGFVQGLCLPLRGFSRSGSTISMGLLLGITREHAEEFSFALAVILTPPVIVLELKRLLSSEMASKAELSALLAPSLMGMVFSFIAGLIALKWLSAWLEKGRWHFFGIYCLVFSVVVLALYLKS